MTYKTLIKIFIYITLIGTLGFLLAQKVNLATADLGRHVMNGRVLWENPFDTAQGGSASHGFWQSDVLHRNTYSYTHPDFEVPNHHWLSGILFYLIYQVVGFAGLSFFYVALLVAAFGLVFFVSTKVAGWKGSVLAALLVIPLIAYRNEVRPEGLSYLFCAVFIACLYYWTKNPKTKLIWLLPLLQILWVNSHVYFFLGPAIVGAFLLPTLPSPFLGRVRERVLGLPRRHSVLLAAPRNDNIWKKLSTLATTIILATLINPFGLKGVLYPFTIFSNYGYRVLENQTVWFLQKLGIYNPAYALFEVVGVLVIVILAYAGIHFFRATEHLKLSVGWWPTVDSRLRGNDNEVSGKNRQYFPLWMIFLALGGIMMGLFAVRNFALFGLFTLPMLAFIINRIFTSKFQWLRSAQVFASALLIVICGQLMLFYNLETNKNNIRGFGILPNVTQAAEFIKKNEIPGPIFNNYDIGGYLIFNLYPIHQVFVDNRPESYPKEFFTDTYVPMQKQEVIWQKQLNKYQFNSIIFYYHDATPWAQHFLTTRVKDPAWAPIYADSYIIIFLRRAGQNQGIISTYELPQSIFRIR